MSGATFVPVLRAGEAQGLSIHSVEPGQLRMEKGMAEDEMVGLHHLLNGHEFG